MDDENTAAAGAQLEASALPNEIPLDGGVDGPILIANEFADVVVSRVLTRNGMRLDIWSPRRGTRVQLDAVELDCLSYQEPETFTEMLARKPGG
ncbi:hypothetical protein [Phytoactinopolyspora limicola]|uniref:hypothetical protein n=1 Tax=Phytoactinopolyspora limicola TaxID=2715536 RepID=UPI001A9C65D4|nr:hypothetical protein [Phytoactinopolyspora limicola]